MRRTLTFLSLAAAGLLASACATEDHQMARSDEAIGLAKASVIHPMALQETGTEAYAWGDKYTAANLFERSADKDGSVAARFNLAYAYEQTGRLPEAAALYAALVRDGQFMWVSQGVDYRDRGARIFHFNIADESARRLAMIQRRMAYAANTGAGAVAATELGAPTAAVVGAGEVTTEHRISDAEAMRLDATGAP